MQKISEIYAYFLRHLASFFEHYIASFLIPVPKYRFSPSDNESLKTAFGSTFVGCAYCFFLILSPKTLTLYACKQVESKHAAQQSKKAQILLHDLCSVANSL